MCSQELAPEHDHLVEPANRRLICACQACAILFEGQTAESAAVYLLAMKLQADPVTGELPCKLLPVGSAFFLPANHGL